MIGTLMATGLRMVLSNKLWFSQLFSEITPSGTCAKRLSITCGAKSCEKKIESCDNRNFQDKKL